jgi:hypothetical protein
MEEKTMLRWLVIALTAIVLVALAAIAVSYHESQKAQKVQAQQISVSESATAVEEVLDCSALAASYAQSSNELDSLLGGNIVEVVALSDTETLDSVIANIDNTFAKLSETLHQANIQGCDTIVFIQEQAKRRFENPVDTEAYLNRYVSEGQLTPQYCEDINTNISASLRDGMIVSRVTEDFETYLRPLLAIAKSSVFGEGGSARYLSYISFYTGGDPQTITDEDIKSLTPEQIEAGNLKVEYFQKIVTSILDFQYLRVDTFCTA